LIIASTHNGMVLSIQAKFAVKGWKEFSEADSMKRLELTPAEIRTLRDMGIFQSHPRTRMRAQAIVRLSQGLTLQQVATEFAGHLNRVDHWRQRRNSDGLTGLY
jgi:hypothetical protein